MLSHGVVWRTLLGLCCLNIAGWPQNRDNQHRVEFPTWREVDPDWWDPQLHVVVAIAPFFIFPLFLSISCLNTKFGGFLYH